MKLVVRSCPDCGRKIRPSNLARHRRARHLPKGEDTSFGKAYSVPQVPIRVGKGSDRRYDEIAPRGEGPERYRIYRLRAGELELIATTGTPEGIGAALVLLHEEGEFSGGDDSVGVLDTATDPGHWIVSPYTLGRRPKDE